eukprot:14131966-Alexandrium_andersonii.AAC.1
MDSVLVLENEFDVFVQTNLADIWRFTLQTGYGPTVRERVEADFDLVNHDSLLQDDNMAAR